MSIALKKIHTFSSYIIYIIHTHTLTERERAPVHLFHLKFTTVCTFMFSNGKLIRIVDNNKCESVLPEQSRAW